MVKGNIEAQEEFNNLNEEIIGKYFLSYKIEMLLQYHVNFEILTTIQEAGEDLKTCAENRDVLNNAIYVHTFYIYYHYIMDKWLKESFQNPYVDIRTTLDDMEHSIKKDVKYKENMCFLTSSPT